MNATEKSGDDCVNSPRWRVECDNRLLRSQDHDNGSVASDSVHLVIDPSRSRPFQSYRTSKIRETQTSTPDTGQTSSSYNGSVSGARQRRLVRDFYAPAMELSLSAFATDIQSTFLIVSIGQKAVTALWEDISHPDDPSKRALETALFARFHPHTVSCEASSKWYGRALTKLSRDLQNPQSIWSTSVLRSAIILTMYELVATTSSSAWIHHAGAIGRLLQLRGPRRHQGFEERPLLEAARPFVVARAAVEGKRCFLERSDWLHIPWAQDPGQKSQFDKLIDLSCMVPAVIENRKDLARHKSNLARVIANKPTTNDHSQHIERYRCIAMALVVRCEQLLDDLRQWKSAWDKLSSPCTTFHSSFKATSYPDYNEDIFGPPLSFPSLYEANHFSMYHQILTSLLRLAYECHYEASSTATNTTNNAINNSLFLKASVNLPPTDHDDLLVERRRCGIEVCRSVPYYLSVELHGCGGAYGIMLPLLMARPIFRPGSDEANYIGSVMTHLAGTWGHEAPKWFG